MRFGSPSNFGPVHFAPTGTTAEFDFDAVAQPQPTEGQMKFVADLRAAWQEAEDEIARLTGREARRPAWQDPASREEASAMIDNGKNARDAIRAELRDARRAHRAQDVDVWTQREREIWTGGANYFRIKISSAGNPYAVLWDGNEWTYDGGNLRTVKATCHRATAAEAAAWGHEFERCVYCDQGLSHPNSVAVGYGEKCASNHGLPWG